MKDASFSIFTESEETQRASDAEVEALERQREQEIIFASYMNCGARKEKLEKAGFDRFIYVQEWNQRQHQMTMHQTALSFVNSVKSGIYTNLVLLGKPGCGKTFLALSIIKELCKVKKTTEYPETFAPMAEKWPTWKEEHYLQCYYVTSDYLTERMRATQSFSSPLKKYDVIGQYADVDLLVIDELGRTNNKYEKDSLFAVIDERNQELKPTVCISNYNAEQLSAMLGEATVSRLNENCMKLDYDFFSQCPYMRGINAGS